MSKHHNAFQLLGGILKGTLPNPTFSAKGVSLIQQYASGGGYYQDVVEKDGVVFFVPCTDAGDALPKDIINGYPGSTGTSLGTLDSNGLPTIGGGEFTVVSGQYVVWTNKFYADSWTGDFSVECWFKASVNITTPGTWYSGPQMLMSNGSGSADGWSLGFGGNGTSEFFPYFGMGGSSGAIAALPTAGSYNDGKWHHAVGTFNHTTGVVKVYCDGEALAVGTNPNPSYAVSTDNQVWAFANAAGIAASISCWALYETELSAQQVASHYNIGYGVAGGSPLTTKGDLFGYSTGPVRVPVGADGRVLKADSTQATGLRWADLASGYDDAVLADSPVGYWPLNETSGTTANDISGNNLNGTYTNMTAIGQTALESGLGLCAEFNGSNSYVVTGTSGLFNFETGPFTLEAWVKPTGVSGGGNFCSKSGNSGYRFRYNSGGQLEALVQGASDIFDATGVILAAGTTYHVVFVYDGVGNQHWYVNGVLNNSGTCSTPTLAGADVMYLGCDSPSNETVTGYMSNIAVYGTALSGTRIAAHYAAATASSGGSSPLTTKGDVYVFGTADSRLPVGANGQTIVADSTQTLGLKWATPSGGGGGDNVIYGVPLGTDAPPSIPSPWDDEFMAGTSLDTSGSRFSGAQPWTIVNQGSATFTLAGGYLRAYTPYRGSGFDMALAVQSLTGTGTTWKFRTKIVNTPFASVNYAWFGLCLYNSGTGQILDMHKVYSGGYNGELDTWSAPTGASVSTITTFNPWSNYGGQFFQPTWFEIECDGTNYIFRYSVTGETDNFTELTPVAISGANVGTATHIGFVISQCNSSSSIGALAVVDWFRRMDGQSPTITYPLPFVTTYVNANVGPDTHPKVPATADDEFEEGVLDGKWSWVNGAALTTTVQGGILQIQGVANGMSNVLGQTAPAGSFTIRAKLALGGISGSYISQGLCIYDSGTTNMSVVGHQVNSGLGGNEIYALNFTGNSYEGSPGNAGAFPNPYNSATATDWLYFEIDWNSSTSTATFKVSPTGVEGTFYTMGTSTFMTNVTHVGFLVQNTTDSAITLCDWFRDYTNGYVPSTGPALQAQPFGPFTDPSAMSSWLLANDGTSTSSTSFDDDGAFNWTTVNAATGNSHIYSQETLPGTWDVQFCISNTGDASDGSQYISFFVRDPTTGNTLGMGSPGSSSLESFYGLQLTSTVGTVPASITYSSTAFSNTPTGKFNLNGAYPFWIRIKYTGSGNYAFFLSSDGKYWFPWFTTNNTWVATPSQFGIVNFNYSGNSRFLSYNGGVG